LRPSLPPEQVERVVEARQLLEVLREYERALGTFGPEFERPALGAPSSADEPALARVAEVWGRIALGRERVAAGRRLLVEFLRTELTTEAATIEALD
jgi:hypothetical protein